MMQLEADNYHDDHDGLHWQGSRLGAEFKLSSYSTSSLQLQLEVQDSRHSTFKVLNFHVQVPNHWPQLELELAGN
jgi:hypothetical protein